LRGLISAGYFAASAAEPGNVPLANYNLQMRKCVVTPIGMKRTTFSLDPVLAGENAVRVKPAGLAIVSENADQPGE
jgi:hypothetical protein